MRSCLLVLHLSICLMAGTAAPAGAQDWVHFGLAGKTVNSVAVDPLNSDALFVGAEEGLYRTTDGGASWDTLEPGLLRGMKALSIYQYTPQDVYATRSVGDSDDGVYKSTDGGVSWNRIYDLACGTSLVTYSGVYAGALNDSGAGGVYRSYDGGATWDTINQGLIDLDVLSLGAIHCFGDSIDVDLAGTRSGIFRRASDDTSWSWVGPAVNASISDFGGGGFQFYSYAAWGNGSWSDGVYKTTDMGETWTVKHYYIYTRTVTTNPLNGISVYAGAVGGGVFRSTDGGDSWEEMNQGLTDLDVTELAFSPTDTTWLYAGTEGGGVFRYGIGPGIEETSHQRLLTPVLGLEPTRPNPFRRKTTIHYQLPAPGHVTMRIFDAGGAMVRTLVDEEQSSGRHTLLWDGRDESGRPVIPGVYFCKLEAAAHSATSKMILLR